MKRADFHYDLPSELIAQQPLPERAASRLLCLESADSSARDRAFRDLPALLAPGDVLVFNDTRVIPARLFAHKTSGGQVEILLERITSACSALAHIRASKAPKPASELVLANGQRLRVLRKFDDGLYAVETSAGTGITELLEHLGQIPLPPYITRAETPDDKMRYQTIYARTPGAVAAPTAGLHFDASVLASLAARGVKFAYVTLHVGAGTFQPVRVDNLSEHHMHAEWLAVGEHTVATVQAAQQAGRRVIAVGTTSVRALETAAQGGALAPYSGDTRLFIYPGYQFKVVDALVTNFHLPESTLLMLVAAFAGYQRVMAAYRHAVAARYRFFSYGDAMWLTRADGVGASANSA